MFFYNVIYNFYVSEAVKGISIFFGAYFIEHQFLKRS
jgi:hypothetical protein